MKGYESNKTQKSLIEFCTPFLASEEKAKEIINQLASEKRSSGDSLIPLQMLNQVKRYIEIIRLIDEQYPERDGLRILFIRICLESICHLSKEDKTLFYSRFSGCFRKEAVDYILSCFVLESRINCANNKELEKYRLTIDDYLKILKYIRNRTAHDGVFWDFRMFSPDGNTYLSIIRTDEKLLGKSTGDNIKNKIQYNFETTLNFDKFIHYYVEACLKYICKFAGYPNLHSI